MKLFDKIRTFFTKRTKKTHRVNFNPRSMEIHDLRHKHKNCGHKYMTNFKDVSEHTAMQMLNKGFDGCRYCMKEFNKESHIIKKKAK